MSASLLAVAALLSGPAAAPPPKRTAACIQLADSSSTHYHPVDDHTIVIESGARWFKLTTTPSSLMLQPNSFFVSEITGPSTLCSPVDFQLSVVEQPAGAREPLIAQTFVQITPEEARALRPRFAR